MIRFFHEKETFKMCYSQCVAWQPSFLVGSSTKQPNFFSFLQLLKLCLTSENHELPYFISSLLGAFEVSWCYFQRGGSFVTDLLHSKPPIFESALPLHQPHEQEKIWNKMKQNVIVCPLQEIRDYYGKFELLSNEYYVRIDFMFIGNCTNLK